MEADFKKVTIRAVFWLCAALLGLGGCRYPRSSLPAGMSRVQYSGLVSAFRQLDESPLPSLGCRQALRVELSGAGWGFVYVQCEPLEENPYAYSKQILRGGAAAGAVARPSLPDFFDTFACHAVTLAEGGPADIDGTFCSFEVIVEEVHLAGFAEEGSVAFEECVELLRQAGVLPEQPQSGAPDGD